MPVELAWTRDGAVILERYRVVLPLTAAAKIEFERDAEADLGNQVRVLDIGNQFIIFYQAGIFAAIGEACGEPIDEYEETTIPPARLEAVIRVLDERDFRITGPEIDRFCDGLLALCRQAIAFDLPLYFIL